MKIVKHDLYHHYLEDYVELRVHLTYADGTEDDRLATEIVEEWIQGQNQLIDARDHEGAPFKKCLYKYGPHDATRSCICKQGRPCMAKTKPETGQCLQCSACAECSRYYHNLLTAVDPDFNTVDYDYGLI